MDDVELLRSFRRLSHLLYHRYSPNASQNRILRVLREKGGMTQKELTEQLDIRAASMSEVLTKLEKAGLIEKTRLETDRRNYAVRITEKGRENAQAHDREREALAERLFRAMSESEKEELQRMLACLAEDWEREK